ncbi:FecR domain-containing protein [Paraglaciecola sp.]|uniref:FecR family protein n=1 Tax=Paraglaciecola sp. TaxID=1920173 RepID=UPI0030F455E2
MNNVYPLKPDDKVLEQASQWISKIDRELDEQETTELHAWLRESELNRDMLVQVASLWDKMDAINQLSDIVPHSPQKEPKRFTRSLSFAASILLASILSVSVYQLSFRDTSQAQTIVSNNQYSTQIGEQSTFYLQDKTKIVLNTNSKLRVTYTDKQRLFELLSGEFHVTVAHNEQQPLNVYAGGKIIQAVGTAFNVRLHDDDNEVELTVTDGKVLVADQTPLSQPPLQLKNVALAKDSLAVAKGQKVELRAEQAKKATLLPADIATDLSWQQGNLVFRGEFLDVAMREVSRYTSYQFELADEQLKQVQIAGLFRTNDIDGLLAALKQNFAISHQRVGNHKILLQAIK